MDVSFIKDSLGVGLTISEEEFRYSLLDSVADLVVFKEIFGVPLEHFSGKDSYDCLNFGNFISDFSKILQIDKMSLRKLMIYDDTTKEFFKILSLSFYRKLDTVSQVASICLISSYLNALLLISPQSRLLRLDTLLMMNSYIGNEKKYINLQNGIWKHCIEELKYEGICDKEIKGTLDVMAEALQKMLRDCPFKEETVFAYFKKHPYK